MKLIVVGRDPKESNIVLSSSYVSSYHAEIIQLDNGDMFLMDKSSNGTFLNGNRITPGKDYPIKRGDSIVFADTPLDWTRIPEVIIPKDVKKIIGIGSNYANDIKVQGPNVSRFHATIRQMNDGKWYICDHSKNGTSVNGRRIAKDNYVMLSPKDEISCAGIPIQNPIPRGSGVGKIIGIAAAAVCVCALVVFAGIKLVGSGDGFGKKMTIAQLCERYERAVVLMLCDYHFTVSCGTLDISDLPDPDSYNSNSGKFTRPLYSEFVVVDGTYIEAYDGNNSTPYTGTGFFVGKNGNIVTNRHIAKPWDCEVISAASGITVITAAEDYFKAKLNKLYQMGYTEALQYISQVKVSGELDHAVVVPNGDYLDERNAYNCQLVGAAEDEDDDLAIFKILTNFPSESTYVPVSAIRTVHPEKGLHITTIGFPFGLYLLDGKTQIQANVTEGSVSRNDNPNNFGFSAPTQHGASGSPVFDDYGHVAGVLWGMVGSTSGFAQAVRSERLSLLLQKYGINE